MPRCRVLDGWFHRLPAQTGGGARHIGRCGARAVRLVAQTGRARDALGLIDLAVCDVSFTSIAHIIDAVLACLKPNGAFCTLVKPQFEADAADVGEGGIVTDPAVRAATLIAAVELFAHKGLYPVDVCVSPIHGAKGNIEFFLYGVRDAARLADRSALDAQVAALSEKAGRL